MSAPSVSFLAPQESPMVGVSQAPKSVTGQPNPHLMTSAAGVVYELVYVTPELADRWLAINTDNRSLRSSQVDKLTRDMTTGRFTENGDALRFDSTGRFMDGQHRLNAIIASQTSAWMLVVSNLPQAAHDTVDDGAKRTAADRFGFHGESDPRTLAAVVRRALLWEHHNVKDRVSRISPSIAELFTFIEEHPELRQAAQAATYYRKMRLLSPSTTGLCWWLFSRLDQTQTTEFFNRLSDGVMLEQNHPVLTLRKTLTGLASGPSIASESHATALTIKAWNYYRAGKELRTLRFADHENFPTPK